MVNVVGDREVGSIGAQGPPGHTGPPGPPGAHGSIEGKVKAGLIHYASGCRI